MKQLLSAIVILFAVNISCFAQKEKEEKEGRQKINVPAVVKSALSTKYPEAVKATWEKEKGNYEANWGGRSGEDHSVQFKPDGTFIEEVNAIKVNQLPKSVLSYVATHYHTKITEAGKVTDASGKQTYEAEVKGKDLIFDMNGKYLKKD